MAKANQKPNTNYGRAKHVAFSIRDMRQKREFPFNRSDIFPDAIVPEGIDVGTRKHAQYLFYSCMIDEAADANIIYEAMRRLVERFDLENLHKLSRSELKGVLTQPFERLGDPERAAVNPIDTLYHNSRKLQEEFEGDPRLILRQGVDKTIKTIMYGKNRKQKFKRYGEGKSALLMKNFVRFGMWDFSEFEIPIKIDRHAIRISLGTGVVEIPESMRRGRAGSLTRILRQIYHEVCMNEKISAIMLNDGMWATGRYNCRHNDDIYCRTACRVGCSHRPEIEGSNKKSSGMTSWYLPGTEKRKNTDNLFRLMSCEE